MLEALILLIIKRKATKDTELTKTIGFSRADWCYIIPTIGFSKTNTYLEIESTWLGFCIYIAYKFDKLD